MEREIIIWGTVVYALAATIITVIKYQRQLISIWSLLHDANMPFIGAFAVMFIFGLFLFSPFTFPRDIFLSLKRKFAAYLKDRKERNLLLKAQSIVYFITKESNISVWPVYAVEFTKSKAWNELNMLSLYVVRMMGNHKQHIANLTEKIDELNFRESTYIQEIEEFKKQLKRLSKPQKPPQDPEGLSLIDLLNLPAPGDITQKPLDYFFDARICNLLKFYAGQNGVKLEKIKDLSKISRSKFKMTRGVGKDTLKLIDIKVKHHQIPMKD